MLLEIRKKNLRMIIKNVVTSKHSDGIMYLIHSSGLGALNPNTVVMSWPQSKKLMIFLIMFFFIPEWKEFPEDRENFIKFIDLTAKLQYHTVILKPDEAFSIYFCLFIRKNYKIWKLTSIMLIFGAFLMRRG